MEDSGSTNRSVMRDLLSIYIHDIFNSLMVAVFAKEVISTRLSKGKGLGGSTAETSAGYLYGGELPGLPE